MDRTTIVTRRTASSLITAAGISAWLPQARAQSAQTLTLWVGSWWGPQVPITQKLWQADNPQIKLVIEPLPINGYLDKFTTATIGGAPPDLIDLDTTWVSTAAAQGLLQKIDDVAAELDVADIAQSVWQASRFRGAQYAVPFRGGPEIYYYNKTVFDRARVPYPDASWNHDDLVRIAQALTIKGEQYGIGVAADASDPSNVMSMLAPMVWFFGGDFLTPDLKAPAINTPASVKGLTYWSDFYVKYGASPEGTPNFSTTRDLMPLFEADKVGLLSSSSNTFDALLQNPKVRWGPVAAPDRINRAGGWTMGIPEGARNPKAARIFLKWLARPQIQAQVMNRFPASTKARLLPPWNDPKWDIFKEVDSSARSLPSVAGWFQMQAALIAELQKVLVRQQTPQQAADATAAKMKQIIAENA
jgi:multiple sugar transport system substrate-binding protein